MEYEIVEIAILSVAVPVIPTFVVDINALFTGLVMDTTGATVSVVGGGGEDPESFTVMSRVSHS
jgi:hypothetical protein